MRQTIVPVILSGGSGTRLWPLSRPERPKQLLPLVSSRTMLQDTLMRLSSLGDRVGAPIVICNSAHGDTVAEQLAEIDVTPRALVLEPEGRNTAPAIAIAAILAGADEEGGDIPALLVLPADHVIEDAQRFCGAVAIGLSAAASDKLVTFGSVPSRPETGYGYIRAGEDHGGWRTVAEFVEKPDLATAEAYAASREYFWNSGMFLFGASKYLATLEEHAPEMLQACRRAVDDARDTGGALRLGDAFLESPADSIDYAVMERTRDAAVVPLDAGWSDVGSWSALYDVLDKDGRGNVVRGDVVAEGCRDCYVSSTGRQVAVIGMQGCVVVATDDAVLVMPHDRAQALKSVVERLAKNERD